MSKTILGRFVLSMAGALSTLLFLTGCPMLNTVRVGRRFPARPADCQVDWQNIDLKEAVARYERVGIVSIGGIGAADIDTNESLREDVRAEACKVGADIAVVGASTDSGLGLAGGSAVWLLHRRGGSGPSAPRPSTKPSVTAAPRASHRVTAAD